jgi:YHS domain-containing protein
MKDPVCGMSVDAARASRKSQFDGREYFFCSHECQQRFDSQPEAYVAPAEKA